MKKKNPTVKRRIFISNTFMVLVTLSLFLIVNLVVIKLYENPYRTDLMRSSELADNTKIIEGLLADWEPSTKEESIRILSEQLNDYGFYLCIEEDENIVYSNSDFSVKELTEEMGKYLDEDGKTHIYVQNYITVLTRDVGNIRVYALSGKYQEFWSQKNRISVLLFLTLIDGILCIGALLIISQLFTKKLIRHITIPLDILSEGAERMKAGNFDEKVKYDGDTEFEAVCDAFNQMQEHITEVNAEKAAYEKARIEMVAGISHDLKTPLTAIRGTIKGLQDGVATTPETRAKFLDIAYRRTLEMDRLLERLFYFSKLETGNMPLFLEITEWSEFLHSYAKRYEMLSENNFVTFDLEKVEPEIFSNIDREQMKRVLDNLVENSKKYAEVDVLKICFYSFIEGSYFVIEVSDNGCGVSADKIGRIFEQFFRGDESRNKKEGNGLGLYIVKYLIESMGGSVTAENREGFTVRLMLPLIEEES